MNNARLGLRKTLEKYALLSLAVGAVLLGLLALLRLFNWLVEWSEPLEWPTFLAGFIVLAMSLGPYVVTVGRLGHVKRIGPAALKTEPGERLRNRRVAQVAGVGVGLLLVVWLVFSRSLTIWLTLGTLFVLMATALIYMAWRIGRIEKAARMTIYQLDYNWYFDKESSIGVMYK